MDQKRISNENSGFWNELCGSQLAKYLGITDSSPESLKKFDDWYFNFYPYLSDHIPFEVLNGKDVLEVGLGYGSVAQRLAETGARYSGLDIAGGPVDMVNHRLNQNGLKGHATQGSVLDPPFKSETFECVVAIGCLHHTGNLQLAIDQCWRLLRPDGQLIFMVYYAYSYRRFRMAPMTTLAYMVKEFAGYRGVVGSSATRERAAYDSNSDGAEAPHTDWISVKSVKKMCAQFSNFTARIENIDQEPPFTNTPRIELLTTRWPKIVGLDLYATATK
ncbi:class I SAM-dependent methyltransferase [Methylotuvimicrobium sp.]|uniref:class I SAM-dependent methyltransferase n=1 Tax=Methylotuvimicrobium sp. TaxID=2822413 RepID=UPI003D65B052